MNIILLEDESIVIKDIELNLKEMGYPTIKAFNKGADFVNYTQEVAPDLCIIDINLNGSMSGIDAVKQLKLFHKFNIPVIYLTAQGDKDTLDKALETMPSAYLLKPFNAFELHAAIELAILNNESLQNSSEKEFEVIKDKIFFKHLNRFESIAVSDLWFLEAEGNYTNLHSERGRFVVVCQLGKFTNFISEHHMFRCHRSYIINLHKVVSFDDKFVYLEGNKIPLAKNRKKEFLKRLSII